MSDGAEDVEIIKSGSMPWKCGKDHILGMTKRNGSGIRILLLYRHAVDMEDESPVEVEVMGRLQGMMLEIKCDVPGCGEARTWAEDAAARRKKAKMYNAE